MTSPENPTRTAALALAHRLRLAAATPWDGEFCDDQAAEFVDQLLERGWRPPTPATAVPSWRHHRDPEANERGLAAVRAALARSKAPTP